MFCSETRDGNCSAPQGTSERNRSRIGLIGQIWIEESFFDDYYSGASSTVSSRITNVSTNQRRADKGNSALGPCRGSNKRNRRSRYFWAAVESLRAGWTVQPDCLLCLRNRGSAHCALLCGGGQPVRGHRRTRPVRARCG